MKRTARVVNDVRVIPNEKFMHVQLILDDDVYTMRPREALDVANRIVDAAEALDQETPR